MWWGLSLLIAYYFIHPFSMAIYQGYFLSSLFYGDSFYVQRKDKLSEPWLWKAFLVSAPVHVIILVAIVELDRTFPHFFPEIVVWIPVLAAVFGIEAVLFDNIADRFSPSITRPPEDAMEIGGHT